VKIEKQRLNRLADDKRNQLMSSMHPAIGPRDTGLEVVDQIDKLNNWGEFQRVLDSIKEQKQHIE
jgi:hypothetical protein